MLSADTNTLYRLTAKELTYGHSVGLVENQKEFVDEFITGKTIFTTLNFANQTIGFSRDIAMNRIVLSKILINSPFLKLTVTGCELGAIEIRPADGECGERP